jgi:hypothetical protein
VLKWCPLSKNHCVLCNLSKRILVIHRRFLAQANLKLLLMLFQCSQLKWLS